MPTKDKESSYILNFLRSPTIKNLSVSLFSVIFGLLLGGAMTYLVGENPMDVVRWIATGAFGSLYDVGMVIYYASILMATGLAVAIPFRAGVFNIGAEGQALLGALAAALVGVYVDLKLPPFFCGLVALLAAMIVAGGWAAIAGFIRAFRGGHEVISSIMLNFIAAGLSSWMVVGFFQATDSQNPETNPISSKFMWPKWEIFDGAPVTAGVLIALLVAYVFFWISKYSQFGFRVSVVRSSPRVAGVAGINIRMARFWSFTMGGMVAGLAGAIMVLGNSGRFRIEIIEGFGFVGIPVALLARGNPVGVVFSALLFAALHHGSAALDVESGKIGRDMAQVIEALVILSVVSVWGLRAWISRFSPSSTWTPGKRWFGSKLNSSAPAGEV